MRPNTLTRRGAVALALAFTLLSQLAAQSDPDRTLTALRGGANRLQRAGSSGWQAASATIEGHALTAGNSPLPRAAVRLRDARTGQIVGTQETTDNGAFSFGPIDAGLYVVELVGEDKFVLAASPLVVANAGQTATTVVRLTSRKAPGEGHPARSVPLAATIISAAAAAGVLAIAATGRDVTGQR